MTRLVPMPGRLFIALFLFLAAAVLAAIPIPLVYRSLGTVLFGYFAFATAGLPAAYVTVLVAPMIGAIRGDLDWFIMMPIILSANLLAMLGLEFGWRNFAIIVSPVLLVLPPIVAWQLSQRELFEVVLPLTGHETEWILLHLLTGVVGVIAAVFFERSRERAHSASEA